MEVIRSEYVALLVDFPIRFKLQIVDWKTDDKEIFINSSVGGNRIAIVENKELTELFIDTPDHRRLVGSIYKGRIQNVIPGMQAAFVDIGHDLNAFLPFSEMGNDENMKQKLTAAKQISSMIKKDPHVVF